MTVYGYRPPEKKVPWFGEDGTIPTVLGQVGGHLKSWFVDPIEPMYQGLLNANRPPEERVNQYPSLGHDLGLPVDRYGKPIDQTQPVSIGDDPYRGSSELSWRPENKGLSDLGLDALGGVGALSELTPFGVLGPVLGNIRRVKSGLKFGQYVGAPTGVDAPGKLAGLTRRTQNLAQEGVAGRFWYEDAGKDILKIFQGNVDEADKFVQFLATTSAGTGVKPNVFHALRQWNQFKDLGIKEVPSKLRPGRFPTMMYDNYKKVIGGDPKYTAGLKREAFYSNLMQEIDPTRVPKDAVTVDMWIMRAYGYNDDVPSASQYDFVQQNIQKVAKQMEWEPHQVQAGMWVNIKARMESKSVREMAQKEAVRKGVGRLIPRVNKEGATTSYKFEVLDDKQFDKIKFSNAMKYKPEPGELGDASRHFGHFLKDNMAYTSWESAPSLNSKVFPEFHNAPYEVKMEFHEDMLKAMSPDGKDPIAEFLGIPAPGNGATGPGRYLEEIGSEEVLSQSPTTVLGHLGPLSTGGQSPAKVLNRRPMTDASAGNMMDEYNAILLSHTNQDSLGWYRTWDKVTFKESSAIQLDFGRPLTHSEVNQVMEVMESNPYLKGEVWQAPNPDGNGITLFHGREHDPTAFFDNTEFSQTVINKIDDLDFKDGVGYTRKGHNGSLIGGKYGKEVGSILDRTRQRSDGYQELSDLLTQARDEVYGRYQTKYGWTGWTPGNITGASSVGGPSGPRVTTVLGPELPPNRGLLDER